jgi:hypothetical protein
MKLLENTIYINLENRKDRYEHVKKELSKIYIDNPVHMPAIKMENGAIGCTVSHIKCIEYAKNKNLPYIFICEDDITFLYPYTLLDSLNKFEQSNLKWDVIIIGGNNVPPYKNVSEFCIQVFNCQTTTGYIVASHYYDTLIKNFRESAKNLIRNPSDKKLYALDIYWKQLQQQDNWYMIVPTSVVQYNDYSDIEGKVVDYQVLMLDINKEWLFQKAKNNNANNVIMQNMTFVQKQN